ncbi:hypothetical protein [Parasphingopyxis sp.]|uniref:hypothetical protein n=1 Tax=Parasphingopyxis sp. TaxID=1920299 RepID=UPI00262F7FE0|nr:hypothetical protein [Parasphingopyxis sp.]
MTFSEGAALYAAALSTILAMISLLRWLADYRPFRLNTPAEAFLPSSSVEAHLTNMSKFQIAVDGIWLGYAFRPWFNPFRRKMLQAVSMSGFDLDTNEDFTIETKVFQPASHIFAGYVGRERFQYRSKLFDKSGFDHRLGVAIEHSLSSRPQILLYKP